MRARCGKSIPVAPFQYFDTEPITDPAELATLEKKLKRRNTGRNSARKRRSQDSGQTKGGGNGQAAIRAAMTAR
jgi:hypothetical protein